MKDVEGNWALWRSHGGPGKPELEHLRDLNAEELASIAEAERSIHRFRKRDAGSTASVGSSRIKTAGSWTRAWASFSRWLAGRCGKSVFVNVGSRGYLVGADVRPRRTRLRDASHLPLVNVVDHR
jgi:hypothetical protein